MSLRGYGDGHVGIYASPDNWRICIKSFIAFKPVKRFEGRREMTCFGGFDNSISKRVLGVLKTTYLRIPYILVK